MNSQDPHSWLLLAGNSGDLFLIDWSQVTTALLSRQALCLISNLPKLAPKDIATNAHWPTSFKAACSSS